MGGGKADGTEGGVPILDVEFRLYAGKLFGREHGEDHVCIHGVIWQYVLLRKAGGKQLGHPVGMAGSALPECGTQEIFKLHAEALVPP